jgi:hypothetical protein
MGIGKTLQSRQNMNVTIKCLGVSMVLAILGGCATSPPMALNNPVGPAKIRPAVAMNQGRLVVYSMSYFGQMDADFERYVHSAYTIYRPDGTKLRTVDNQTGLFNGDPEAIQLTTGDYRVKAETYRGNWVTLPVVIEPGRTTVVDLNREWWSDHAIADQTVKLPDGAVIGAAAQ